MRQLILWIAPLLFLLPACSKKDVQPKLAITQSKTEITYKEQSQLKASIGNNEDYIWTSSNNFVGTISASGQFSAAHIGKTTITAKKNDLQTSVEILVSPTETFYPEPIIEMGANMAIIKAKEKRTLSSEGSDYLIYTDPSPVVRVGILYSFTEGLCTGIVVAFHPTSANATKVLTFYAERYSYLGGNDDLYVFNDHYQKSTIGLYPDHEDFGFSVIYVKHMPTVSINTQMANLVKSSIPIQKQLLRQDFSFDRD